MPRRHERDAQTFADRDGGTARRPWMTQLLLVVRRRNERAAPIDETEIAQRWERTRRDARHGVSPPTQADAIARWVTRTSNLERRRMTVTADIDVAVPVALDHKPESTAAPDRPVLPHPHPVTGDQPARIASYRELIRTQPNRHSPCLDYGIRWVSGPGLDDWRVLWNIATREMFAIHHHPQLTGEIVIMGVCVDQAHADAVIASLHALNQLADHCATATRHHRVTVDIGAEPPGPRGVRFTLYGNGVGSIDTAGHAVQDDDIDTAVEQHHAANSIDACQQRITEQVDRHYRAKAARTPQYGARRPTNNVDSATSIVNRRPQAPTAEASPTTTSPTLEH